MHNSLDHTLVYIYVLYQQHASPKVGRARLSTPTSPVIPTPQKTPFSKRVTPEKLPSIPDPPQEAYEVLPEPNNNVKPSEMVKQKKKNS